ncbi:MAG: rhodanese-like domain-containing protein [Desulfobulbus sp.]|jgi:rhodanese-related sulfurtransferase
MDKRTPSLCTWSLLAILALGIGTLTSPAVAAETTTPDQAVQKTDTASTQLVYEGEVTGVSERARSISITVGKDAEAKTMLVRFDQHTKGMAQAAKGRPMRIFYTMRGNEAYATEVQLKVAQLPEGIAEIRTEELRSLLESGKPVFLVDSRPPNRFAQGHLPDAHSIPMPVLKEKKGAVLPKDKEQPVIFYCGGITCPLSPASAVIAKQLGYTDVRVYHEGEPEWAKAALPLYSTQEFVLSGDAVVLDLRTRDTAVAGRVRGAYSTPYDGLEDSLGDVARNAPLILYAGTEAPTEAIEILHEEGFNTVSLIRGGYKGWVASGGPVEKGPIFNTEIRWVRKLGKGEVSVEDFRKAASGEDKDALIVDSRTEEEIAELGIFRHTVNIPLDELPARMNELPKDKKIYVHCSTGARADMAYNELVKHGFNVKFLLLDISDAACDCEIIRP